MFAFAAIGGAVAWLAWPERVVAPAPPVAIVLDGQPLFDSVRSPSGRADGQDEDASMAIARAWLARPVAIVVEGERTDKTREQLGARVDAARVKSLLAQARDARSVLRRRHARLAPGAPLALAVPFTIDADAAMAALLQVKDEHDRAPVDAHFDLETRRVSRDVPGRQVDARSTLAKLEDALWAGATNVDAIVETVPARRTAAQIEGVQADAVLGWFETKYARDVRHEPRSFNLRLAASKLDGHVVLPGETFDFNQVVGARNEANGYKVAPVIAQGELVDGIGGGTCQIAGTLHSAAFFAGLEIPERKPHTRPSFYIKMGLDAAVAYPAVTLQIRNPYPFAIVLHERVDRGVVRAEILGPKRTRDVTFARRIDDVVAFAEKEVPDEKLPKGARELKQRGIPGFKVTRWRILRDGPFAVREHHQDYYPPTTQIWRVGAGPAHQDSKFEANDDEHPEYVADHYLEISQGPDIKGSHGTDTIESRVPGRTGEYGWTVREGFTKDTEGTHAKKTGNAEDREGID